MQVKPDCLAGWSG